ncbi:MULTISPECIES: complex I subunit 4 family protein [Limnochorda]|uniref:complex I subunit 4 family protein n=1 Tax=Limnochorda TaxID=1676651 RepID=UPI0017D83EAB|nr:NADH-quinone oxidoreductase subunit M [Limnochorda pilosa]MBO2486342.1 oxidoreductase [Bacillota bacterium]MBO2518805.1 oxidoreductase [Bacillota bacterium]NMA71895.1 NADH-quinone oxidoreductase subunit M [Bacillota bacterium]
MLTALVFTPLVGALVILFMNKEKEQQIRRTALAFSLIPLLIVLLMAFQFEPGAGMQFVERYEWIPSIGVSYYLGTDGISFPMLVVTALVTPLAILASFSITHRVKEFFALFLLLETGMLGVFVALDYFLFYIFWEVVLVPMYFLIGIWGGPRRQYASIKFFIYTLAGSVVMLVGILALYFASGLGTFDMLAIAEHGRLGRFDPTFQVWVFLALFFGFAVKVPIFPFHTWLPDAHVEAPTGGSMVLAGVLLKMGTYGFFRIAVPTLPEAAAQFAFPMALLGVIAIVYGALAAMAQPDLKKMVAYSSISHMGYVVLGIAAGVAGGSTMAMNGALFVMVSHGIISPLMFFLAGTMVYERTHTRMIPEMGGLWSQVPVVGTVLAFAAFANLGLPGLSGFAGEFFTFVGSFPVYTTLVIVGALGLILTAGYHLWMMQRVLLGEPKGSPGGMVDITGRELVVSVPLMALTLALGIFPPLLLDLVNPSVVALINQVQLALGGF